MSFRPPLFKPPAPPAIAERLLATATLAAGIVQARGATSVEAIRDAYRDASFIVDPQPGSERYEAWAEAHGDSTPASAE